MKRFFTGLILSFVFLSYLLLPQTVFGASSSTSASIGEQLRAAAGDKGAGFGEAQDPRLTVANIIRVGLELLGTIAVVLIIYAGFLWMTAGGNEDQVSKSKKILFQSVIGLVIILCAYSITLIVIKVAIGKWTDYENIDYINQSQPIECRDGSC